MGIGIVTLPKNSSSQKRPSRFISNTLWKSSAPPIVLRPFRSASAAASSSSNPRLSITPKSYSKLPLSLDSPSSHYQYSRNTGSTVSYVDCCGSHRVVRLTVRLRRLMWRRLCPADSPVPPDGLRRITYGREAVLTDGLENRSKRRGSFSAKTVSSVPCWLARIGVAPVARVGRVYVGYTGDCGGGWLVSQSADTDRRYSLVIRIDDTACCGSDWVGKSQPGVFE